MNTRYTRAWIVAAVPALPLGCGGGAGGGAGGNNSGAGGNNSGGDNTIGGIDRGGITISQGPISGFGSVIVNGVHFDTAGAAITIEDAPGSESDLRVGQVVRVEGTLDASGSTGTARSVQFDDALEGPVQSIDLDASRLSVLGQVVYVGSLTSFDDAISPRSLAGLVVGDRIEVSGLTAADGSILATRVDRAAPGISVEVKGTASNVDVAARRLQIGQLLVNYASAQLTGFPGGQPVSGDLVEARGTVDGSGALAASSLELRSASLSGTGDDTGELEGLVTRFVSPGDFDVAGQPVTAGTGTSYDDGTAADLASGVLVEVEGGFDSTGRIVARKIAFRRSADVEISAPVDSVNSATGTLVVLGTSIRTSATTRLEDHSEVDVERFSLSDLRAGDFVEIRGYADGGGLTATFLERDDPESRIEIRGPVGAVRSPEFEVVGVVITTDGQTEFRDNNGATISSAAFFAAAPGHGVKVRGVSVGNAVLAERAELEN